MTEMNEQRAREILCGKNVFSDLQPPASGEYVNWLEGDAKATLDGQFNAEELEAIAWWMRNKGAS